MGVSKGAHDDSLADTATDVVVLLHEAWVCPEELECEPNSATGGCLSSIWTPCATDPPESCGSALPDAEYIVAAFRHQQERERRLQPSPCYLEQHSPSQCPAQHITSHMRLVVTSWMVEVASDLRLQQETLHLAIALLDRLLSATQAVPRSALQPLSVACIMVAAKQLEVGHPSVQELTQLGAASFEESDLLRMEHVLLASLDFHIISPTPHSFLNLLLQGLPGLPRTVARTAALLAELSLLDYDMLVFAPSETAVCALHLAMLTAGHGPSWDALMTISGYAPEALQACLRRLHRLHRDVYAAACGDGDIATAHLLPVWQRHTPALLPLPQLALCSAA